MTSTWGPTACRTTSRSAAARRPRRRARNGGGPAGSTRWRSAPPSSRSSPRIAALEAGNYANEALFAANAGVLRQTQAVDTWSEYQADSIKKYEAQNLAALLAHTGGTPQEIQAARDEATRRQAQQDTLQPEAARLGDETAALNAESRTNLAHHHRFAVAVTLFQVAIGLSAIAALLRRRVVWLVSLAVGALALLALLDGFRLFL